MPNPANQETRNVQEISIEIDPWSERRGPFLKLCRALAEQSDRFTHSADPKADLSAAARGLSAVIDFLCVAVPTAPELSTPLNGLLSALAGLSDGRMSPMLKPKRRRAGQSKPVEHELRWAAAAACITLMMQEGASQKTAVGKVQSLFEKYNVPLPGKGWRSLQDWRTRLLERHPDDPIRVGYDRAITSACATASANCTSAAHALFAVLAQDLIGRPAHSTYETRD